MDNTTLPYAGPKTPRPKLWILYLFATVGVLLGVLLREPITELFWRMLASPATGTVQVSPAAVKVAGQRAVAHLNWADAESQSEIEPHLRKLKDHLSNYRAQSKSFAEEALGLGSKWRFVADKLPFTRTDRHAEYLRDSFARHYFTPEQLSQQIEDVVIGYARSLESKENEMLVRIRADVADLPHASLPAFYSDESLRRAYDLAISDAMIGVQRDLRNDTVRQVALWVAEEVIRVVAVRLGVSAGILATGAGSSWATSGASLVIAAIVETVLEAVWNWWADPVGKLEDLMNEKLNQIFHEIIEGDGGLRSKLTELYEERKQVRHRAVSNLIEGKVQP